MIQLFPQLLKKTGAVICAAFHPIRQTVKQKPLEGATEALEAVSNIKGLENCKSFQDYKKVPQNFPPLRNASFTESI